MSMSKKRKRKLIRIEKRKIGDKSRFRIVFLNKELFGFNSHELPRAKRRGDRRPIKHIHPPYPFAKFHIPLDAKYIKYVITDFGKAIKRKFGKKNKGNRKKDKRT